MAYIIGGNHDVVVWRAQREYLQQVVDDALAAPSPSHFRFFAHLVWCTATSSGRDWKADPWSARIGVPVYHGLIEDLDENRKSPSALNVYGPLVNAGLVDFHEHHSGHGLSRNYFVRMRHDQKFLEAASKGPEDGGERCYLISGKRTTRREKTRKVDANKNPIGPPLWRDAVALIEYDYFDRKGLKGYLFDFDGRVKEAEQRWLRSVPDPTCPDTFKYDLEQRLEHYVRQKGNYYLDAGYHGVINKYAKEHGNPLHPAYDEYRRLAYRYKNDLSCYHAILRQQPEDSAYDGIMRFKPAYKFQSTGRVSAMGGMLQSCSRTMKAAAREGIPGVRNYDMVSSQPNLCIELFEEANAIGGGELKKRPLAAKWLASYVEDKDSKYRYAREVGVEVDTWKAVFCAVLMGARLPRPNWVSHGEIIAALKADPACVSAKDARRLVENLNRVLGELYGELQRWHRWLDQVHAKQGPNAPGGHWVRNAVGATYHWKKATKWHKRRAELAAHLLQGKEQAFVMNLIKSSANHDFEVIAHEHDGLVTIGEIPDEAVEWAKERGGVRRVWLAEKPFV